MQKILLQRCRNALADGLFDMAPNIFLTFNFNPPRSSSPKDLRTLMGGWEINSEDACKRITKFFNVLQRRAFGRSWYRNTIREWPIAYGFAEHLNTNIHYHVLARMDEATITALINRGYVEWHKLCRGGQLDFRGIDEVIGLSGYITKELVTRQAYESIFTYSDPRK